VRQVCGDIIAGDSSSIAARSLCDAVEIKFLDGT
jgi:hypothetical protein